MIVPRTDEEREAAIKLQAAERGRTGRATAGELAAERRLQIVRAKSKRKSAVAIQNQWRSRTTGVQASDEAGAAADVELRGEESLDQSPAVDQAFLEGCENQEEMAARIQAAYRGSAVRVQLEGDAQKAQLVEEYAKKRAARVIQKHVLRSADNAKIVQECHGVMEKQGRKYSLAKWEVVVWQERYVRVTPTAMVYQRLSPKGEAKGKEKEIPFSSMLQVKALLGETLFIKCTNRDYYFHVREGGSIGCETWATNIVQLATIAGHDVPGYVVCAPDHVLPESALET